MFIIKSAHRGRGQIDPLHGIVAVPGERPVTPFARTGDEDRFGDMLDPLVVVSLVCGTEKTMGATRELKLRSGASSTASAARGARGRSRA